MKQRQKARRSHDKKYKNKYVSIKDIYNTLKSGIRIKTNKADRMISYSEYYAIMESFLEGVVDTVANKQEVFKMPLKMGEVYIKKLPHKRPFHVRVDHAKSKEEGKVVLYKVPILDDEYAKVMWDRPHKFNKHKILPLARFKEAIKK
tara:strand:+ start:11186 stop:11626 length:441 start_codon:yes stop_codon:yes gene_type:complete